MLSMGLLQLRKHRLRLLVLRRRRKRKGELLLALRRAWRRLRPAKQLLLRQAKAKGVGQLLLPLRRARRRRVNAYVRCSCSVPSKPPSTPAHRLRLVSTGSAATHARAHGYIGPHRATASVCWVERSAVLAAQPRLEG